MDSPKPLTPTKLPRKAVGLIGSASLNKIPKEAKNYLPSRFMPEKPASKNFPQEVLHNVEQLAKSSDANALLKSRLRNTPEPKILIDMYNKKQVEPQEFKSKPMKRYESDYLSFKEIFVQPREQILKDIQTRELPPDLKESLSEKQEPTDENKHGKSPDRREYDIRAYVDIGIQFLDSKSDIKDAESSSNFYEEMVKVQPPDLPNSSVASTLTPGNGYAPSIPLTYMVKEGKTNLRDLLVRAKAGIHAEDVQKEAHLSFFLGMVYESRKQYDLAVKFYRRFLGFAKTMEDKIGMALGSNRIAVNEYNRGNYQKSITYNQENLRLSDKENTFAAFYNLGICYRCLEKYPQALEYFENALQWGLQRDQVEEYCMTYGQLGVTYLRMQLYQQAIQNFEKCLQLSRKLRKTQIELDNLLYITKITTRFGLKSQQNIETLLEDTLKNAATLLNKKVAGLTVCNMGILKGRDEFQQYRSSCQFEGDCEPCD